MVMKTVLDTLDDIAEPLREHYKEIADSKDANKKIFVLDIEGSIDPLPGVKALRTENGGYRIKLRDAEAKYGKLEAFKDMDPAEVLAKLDRITELEAAAGGKLDDAAIEKIVEGRIKGKMGPLERQMAALAAERDGFKAKNDEYTQKEKTRMIGDSVRAAATALKLQPEAVDDAIMYAERVMEVNEQGEVVIKDAVGFTPGIDAKAWLGDMQAKRPHWWGPSAGGGAKGGGGGNGFLGGANPFSFEGWNLTEQGKLFNTDKKRAEQLAAQAGTTVGGRKPQPKAK